LILLWSCVSHLVRKSFGLLFLLLFTQSFKLLLKFVYFNILPVSWLDFVKEPETKMTSWNGNIRNSYQVYQCGEHNVYSGDSDWLPPPKKKLLNLKQEHWTWILVICYWEICWCFPCVFICLSRVRYFYWNCNHFLFDSA